MPKPDRAALAALLARSRTRRRSEGAPVCPGCGGELWSALRSLCPVCRLAKTRRLSRERYRTRAPRDRDRTTDLFPELPEEDDEDLFPEL